MNCLSMTNNKINIYSLSRQPIVSIVCFVTLLSVIAFSISPKKFLIKSGEQDFSIFCLEENAKQVMRRNELNFWRTSFNMNAISAHFSENLQLCFTQVGVLGLWPLILFYLAIISNSQLPPLIFILSLVLIFIRGASQSRAPPTVFHHC